jgi:gliding motility-associated-like protein
MRSPRIILFLLLYLPVIISAQLSDQLIAKYYFNDGTANNEVGSVHGLVGGATLTEDRWGNPNKAFHFAEGQYISLGDSFDEIFTRQDSAFSWSFWMRTDGLDNLNTIPISKYGGALCSENERAFFIRLNAQYELDFLYYMTKHIEKYRSVQANTPIFDTCWHHIVVNYDPANNNNDGLDRVTFFIDNVAQATSYFVLPLGMLGHIQNTSAMLSLGTPLSSLSEPCFDTYLGKLDDIRLYGRMLTADDVNQLYHELNPVTQNNWASSVVGFELSDTLICQSSCVDILPNIPCEYSFNWTHDGGQNFAMDLPTQPRICYEQPGVYAIKLWVDLGYATDSITKYITVHEKPIFSLGNDTTICNGASVFLQPEVIAADQYNWSTGDTDPFLLITETNTYTLSASNDACSTSDTIEVTVLPINYNVLGADTFLCVLDDFVLDIPSVDGVSGVWSTGSTADTVLINVPGTYWVDLYEYDGYCHNRDSINISKVNLSQFSLGSDTTLCHSQSIHLSVYAPQAMIQWSDGSTGQYITVNNSGQYWASAELDNCVFSDTIEVNVLPLSYNILGADTFLCVLDDFVLDIPSVDGVSGVWSTGSTADTVLINAPGTYWVDLYEYDGFCHNRDSINISKVNLSQFSLGSDTTLCHSQSIHLSVNAPQAMIQWSDGSTGQSITVNNSGQYRASAELDNCVFSDTIEVNVLPISYNILGADTLLCVLDDFVLDIPSVNSVLGIWSNGSIGDTILINVPGTYWVDLYEHDGYCHNRDSINISKVNLSQFSLGSDTTLCHGQSIPLSVNAPQAMIQWSDGSTGQSITVNNSGQYWVSAELENCIFSDTIEVTVLPISYNILGADTLLCVLEDFVLDIPSVDGVSGVWSNGSTADTVFINAPGTYWVDLYEYDGYCHVRDSINISKVYLSQFSLGSDTTICQGQSIPLSVYAPQAMVQWSDGSTGQSITVNNSGQYWASAELQNCVFSDTIQVFVQTPIVIDLGPDSTICIADTVLLSVESAGGPVLWSTGQTDNSIMVNNSGIYSVQVTDGVCLIRDTIELEIGVLQSFDLGNDTIRCGDNSITIGATVPGNYLWSNNAQQNFITITEGGQYWLQIEKEDCFFSDTINITDVPLPEILTPADTMICPGVEWLVNIQQPQVLSYQWQDGATSSSYLIQEPGLYSYTVSNECATLFAELEVQYTPELVLELGADTAFCSGETYVLDVFQEAATNYLWQDGSTESSREILNTDLYAVTVSNACENLSDEIDITVMPGDLIPSFNKIQVVCKDSVIILDATTENAKTYLWQDGSTEAVREVLHPGRYYVTITNACLEQNTFIEVSERNCCQVYVPNAFSPNRDGVNDQLEIFSNCELGDFEFKIFNRFGALVYQTSDINQFWDGTVKGQQITQGVYAYMLRYFDGKRHQIKSGDISIFK